MKFKFWIQRSDLKNNESWDKERYNFQISGYTYFNRDDFNIEFRQAYKAIRRIDNV